MQSAGSFRAYVLKLHAVFLLQFGTSKAGACRLGHFQKRVCKTTNMKEAKQAWVCNSVS